MKIVAKASEPVPVDRIAQEARAEAAPAAQPPPAGAEGSTAVGEAARAEVRRLLAAWRVHEVGARLGADPEELHQLRVTARRLDATLGLFKEHLAAPLVRARKTAKSLLRTLGATRDLDVQLAGLAAYCLELPEEERSALEPLSERLKHERARARARMVRALDSETTRRWLQTLAAASESASVEADASVVTVAAVMPRRVRRRFRRLRKAVQRLRPSSSMEDYHKVRRRAKQLRYALESGAFNYGKPAEEMLRALRRLQDKLGVQQDAYIARNHLTALAADAACGLPPATLFLMGKLAEHHGRVSTDARARVTGCWRKVRGRRWKALRARLKEFDHPEPREAAPASIVMMADGATPTPEDRPLSH